MIGRQMNIYIRKPVMFTVTWKVNGSVVKTEQVEFGESATPPNNINVSEGYELTGWDKDYNDIRSNIEINAIIKIKKFTVRFFDGSKLISAQTVEYNKSATAPLESQLDDRDNMEFVGWDKSYTNVKSNLDVYSVWQIPRAEPITLWQHILPTIEEAFDPILQSDKKHFNRYEAFVAGGWDTNVLKEHRYRIQVSGSTRVNAMVEHVDYGNRVVSNITTEGKYTPRFMLKSGNKWLSPDEATDKYLKVTMSEGWSSSDEILKTESGEYIRCIAITPPDCVDVKNNPALRTGTMSIKYKDQTTSIKITVDPMELLIIWGDDYDWGRLWSWRDCNHTGSLGFTYADICKAVYQLEQSDESNSNQTVLGCNYVPRLYLLSGQNITGRTGHSKYNNVVALTDVRFNSVPMGTLDSGRGKTDTFNPATHHITFNTDKSRGRYTVKTASEKLFYQTPLLITGYGDGHKGDWCGDTLARKSTVTFKYDQYEIKVHTVNFGYFTHSND